MKELGFEYRYKKKSYYVDRREDKDVVHYRKQYVKNHFETELAEACWVRMSLILYKKLVVHGTEKHEKVKIKVEEKKNAQALSDFIEGDVHHYTNENGTK